MGGEAGSCVLWMFHVMCREDIGQPGDFAEERPGQVALSWSAMLSDLNICLQSTCHQTMPLFSHPCRHFLLIQGLLKRVAYIGN